MSAMRPYTSMTQIPAGAQTIAPTAGLFVMTAGIVQVGGNNGALINLGTLAAGQQLDGWSITKVGAATTATLVALR